MLDDVYSAYLLSNVAMFQAIFCRVLGFVIIAPYFKSMKIPKKTLVLFSLMLSYMTLLAFVEKVNVNESSNYSVELSLFDGLINIFIGFLYGLAALISLEIVQLAGKLIAFAMQLGFAQMVDPMSGKQSDAVSTTLYIVFSLVFVSGGGLQLIIDMLMTSFNIYPLFSPDISQLMLIDFARMFSLAFMYGLMIAIPFTATGLLLNTGLAVISKTAPSMNLFTIGFPLAIILGITALGLVLPSIISDLYIFVLKLKESYLSVLS